MPGAPATPKRKAPRSSPRQPARQPARPAGLAHGRWLGDFDPPPSKAELALIACCERGEEWVPTDWNFRRPFEATEANTVRSEIIRFLALGGDWRHPVHEEGVMAEGAWINGELDLHQCHSVVQLDLHCCHFVDSPNFV